MKNLLELDLIYCLDALKMLECVLLSHLLACMNIEQAEGRVWHGSLL